MSTIVVLGSGYVGLVVALGFAHMGFDVVNLDIDSEKIDNLSKGILPFYESSIEKYLKKTLETGKLRFSTGMEYGIAQADVIFLAVGTPSKKDGSADLRFIEKAVEDVARFARGYTVVITKSTVPVGTNRSLQAILNQQALPKGDESEIDVVSNPEFLREGRAMEDFLNPERIVLGVQSKRAKRVVAELYGRSDLSSAPCVWCNWETAELIKYASNCFLATKITFINQVSNLAEILGANIETVSKALGMDPRIGASFLKPGPGYGGSCLPKDTRAMIQTALENETDISIINSVVEANENQKERVFRELETMVGKLSGKKIAVLGLTFKAETDDVRESPSLALVQALLLADAIVQVHDPRGMDNFKVYFPDILYCSSAMEALQKADAMVIMTEWNEYRTLSLKQACAVMNKACILDTRNLFEFYAVRNAGFTYRASGRGDLRIQDR